MKHKTVDSFQVALGLAIAARRKSMRLTQKELAKDVWITNVYLSYLERGKTSVSLPLIRSIAERFGVRLSTLIIEAEANLR